MIPHHYHMFEFNTADPMILQLRQSPYTSHTVS